MKEAFLGTGVALITPFTGDLKVDFHALERLVNHVVEGGVEYLVVLGTTAESATLDRAEKKELLRFMRDVNRGRIPLVAGIGGNNTRAVAEEMQQTDLDGYQAILSVSPYYNRPTQEGIFQHFQTLSQISPLPLILYNVPSRTGSNMLPDTVLRLASVGGKVLGIKEASGDMEQIRVLLREAPEGFLVISGDDLTAVPTVLDGGAGVISVLGQGIPQIFSNMVRLALEGRESEAFEVHQRIEPLVELIFREGNPAGIKALLHHLGICDKGVRLPLVSASETLAETIGYFLDNQLLVGDFR
jgi:4-hydroxy-tetrahydrodipicolinate synthase